MGDTVMFGVEARTNKPPCSLSGNEWAFSLNSQTGITMYALLLTVQAK